MVPIELPVFSPVPYYLGEFIMDYAALKNSPNKDSAVRWMRHLSSGDAAEDWTHYAKSPSGSKSDLDAASSGGDVHESFIHYIDGKYGNRIHLFNINDMSFLFGRRNRLDPGLWNRQLVALLSGRTTTDRALAELRPFVR
jgi:hypothetical protein